MTVSALESLLLGYAVGSIPFAFLLAAWIRGVDIRTAGSRNVGAANVARTSGSLVAAAVVMLDAGKGAAAVALASLVTPGPHAGAWAGVAAVAGHVFPVWLGFRGGKGVATTGGVFAVLAPVAAAAATVIFLAVVFQTRYVSLGSMVAAAALAPFAYLSGVPAAHVVAAAAACTIVLYRHRSNLVRLRAGTERRLGQRV